MPKQSIGSASPECRKGTGSHDEPHGGDVAVHERCESSCTAKHHWDDGCRAVVHADADGDEAIAEEEHGT
jgi:hypothetical protein